MHRLRMQRAKDDPGAKACEAMCMLLVAGLFAAVGWILWTHGLARTFTLLFEPQASAVSSFGAGSSSPFFLVYRTAWSPEGYGRWVSIVHEGDAATQRVSFHTEAGVATVHADALQRLTVWELPDAQGGAQTADSPCFVLLDDTRLSSGKLLPPSAGFSRHGAFTPSPAEPGAEASRPLARDVSTCVAAARAPSAPGSQPLACLHVPCVDAPAGWCRECVFSV